jgi:predicted MFS family arabinose efflux permease
MIAADLARAALALGFLLAARLSSLAVIYAVGAALFAVSAFFNAAKRAAIPNLVEGTDELLAANSLSASTTAATIAVGSALGGAVATALGRDTVFILNALTFLASAEMIRRIRRRLGGRQGADEVKPKAERLEQKNSDVVRSAENAVQENARGVEDNARGLEVQTPEVTAYRSPLTAYFSDFREGLRYVRRDAVLSAVFVAAARWGLGNGAARALYSIFGARLGEQAAAGWGAGVRAVAERPTDFGISVLYVAMGVGGVLGAPLARRFNRGGSGDLGARMGRSLTLDGAGLLLFSFMPNLLGAAVVLVAREMNFAIWWTAQQTLVMRRTEDRFAGRVFASFETLTTLMMVGSILVSGEVADRLGIRPVAAGGGSVVILSGLLWFILRRREERRR